VTRHRFFRRALQALGLLILSGSLTALGALYSLGRSMTGPLHVRGAPHFAPVTETRQLIEAAFHPQQLFPGRTRLNILCLGLDRDWTDQDLPSSKQSRTDTMIVASLDLAAQRVTALSIPRDTRVEIPRHGFRKINDAYPCGGLDGTLATVNQFLGVPMDYYILVKLGAVQRFVDAIGGVTVDVEKDMDYDDDWGQLHVHLKQGSQPLSGAQVEGYMRFRHDREGDFGRMRRQQQTVKAILAKLQSPAVALRVPRLIDAFSKSIETNLTRDQIVALARMFHQVRPDKVVSDTIPGRNRMLDRVAYVQPDMRRQKLLVDWLLRGDETAANPLTTVRVLNGCRSRKVTREVVRQLAAQQFDVSYAGRAREETPVTRVEGHGLHPDDGQRVLAALHGGTPGTVRAVTVRERCGTEPSVVTVIVGQDQVAPPATARTAPAGSRSAG
jgi:polyisoprenyl-teichoic acid--peptidoglycan teichoic acid transferase